MVSPISAIPARHVDSLPRFHRTRIEVYLALAAWLLTTAGCASFSLQREMLVQQPDGLLVERVTGAFTPGAPPPPGDLPVEVILDSLRRITVRYHRVISLLTTDPEPLLSESQAQGFSEILQRELPRLSPQQRVRFHFRDIKKNNLNEMDVYRDGNYLVYDFANLVANPDLATDVGGIPRTDATAYELPGQIVRSSFPKAIFKDSVVGDQNPKQLRANQVLTMIGAARAQGTLAEEEVARLRTLIEQRPEITLESLRAYLDKRGTLNKAHAQGLMDDLAYRTQLERLERELVP